MMDRIIKWLIVRLPATYFHDDRPLGGHGEGASERPIESAAFGWFVGLATAQTVTVILLYWFVPATRRLLIREQGIVEWATALLFLAAAVAGYRRLLTAGVRWRDPRWIIPTLSLLAMLDEASWVIFPLGVEAPTVLGKRLDGLHDILDVGVIWIRHHAPWWCVLVVGAVMVSALAWAAPRAPRGWRFVRRSAPWQFFALAAALGAVAQILDVTAPRRPVAQLFEEVLEMDGALAFLFSTRHLVCRPPARRGSPSA